MAGTNKRNNSLYVNWYNIQSDTLNNVVRTDKFITMYWLKFKFSQCQCYYKYTHVHSTSTFPSTYNYTLS